jgi:DHA1 family florfenicol/chloramphenicol resistance protein-like MFS transporter
MLVATFATVRDVFASRPEGPRIYAVMSGVLVFVPAFGPLLGAILYAAGGLRAVFLAMAVSSAVAGLRAFRGWPETKPVGAETTRLHAFGTVLRSGEFWTYTLGYAVAMGSFFVFLSIAPELLIHHYGYSPLGFAVVFGAVAFVLIGASRFSSRIAERHGLVACFARGLGLIVFGALLLLIRETVRDSVVAFVLPMTVIVVGISMTVAVTANGALAGFSEMAGTATALYHCTSGVILVGVGTVAVVLLPHRTAWPLVAYGGLGASVVLLLLARSKRVSRR